MRYANLRLKIISNGGADARPLKKRDTAVKVKVENFSEDSGVTGRGV